MAYTAKHRFARIAPRKARLIMDLVRGRDVDDAISMLKFAKQRASGMVEKVIRTWARACTIIPEFVGHNFEVHNGNKFIRVFVTEDMVGHKLGEFSPTRQFRGHSGAKKAGA